jgi:hypothetical protein
VSIPVVSSINVPIVKISLKQGLKMSLFIAPNGTFEQHQKAGF